MRVILFKDRFAELVRTGEKRQTIREQARCKWGDKLSLRRWTGKPYRSKQEVLLETMCADVLDIIITETGIINHLGGQADHEAIAKRDGFRDWAEMREWFRNVHGLPFNGNVILW